MVDVAPNVVTIAAIFPAIFETAWPAYIRSVITPLADGWRLRDAGIRICVAYWCSPNDGCVMTLAQRIVIVGTCAGIPACVVILNMGDLAGLFSLRAKTGWDLVAIS